MAESDLTRWRQDEPLGLSFGFGDWTDNTKTFYTWLLKRRENVVKTSFTRLNVGGF